MNGQALALGAGALALILFLNRKAYAVTSEAPSSIPDEPSKPAPAAPTASEAPKLPSSSGTDYRGADIMGYATSAVRREMALLAGLADVPTFAIVRLNPTTFQVWNGNTDTGHVSNDALRASLVKHGLIDS